VFDTEGTGLTKLVGNLQQPLSVAKSGAEVIEIGGLFLDERLQPIKFFKHYCDCMAPHSDAQAFAVHGIELEFIRRYVSGVFFEEVVATWLPEFLEDDILFIGYNVDFDLKMAAQSMRDFPKQFIMPKRMFVKVPRRGRYSLDVMQYLPQKRKLSSYEDALAEERQHFWATYRRAVPRESNCQGWADVEWDRETAHDSFFDALETYLLLTTQIAGKKILFGR